MGTSDVEKLHEPLGECNLRIFKMTSTYYSRILREGHVIFFIYSTFNKIRSFPWKLDRYSYGVQFGINCTALGQSKLSNFVECTIISGIHLLSITRQIVKQSKVTTVVPIHIRTITITTGFASSPRELSSGSIDFAVIGYPFPLFRIAIFFQADIILVFIRSIVLFKSFHSFSLSMETRSLLV